MLATLTTESRTEFGFRGREYIARDLKAKLDSVMKSRRADLEIKHKEAGNPREESRL